MITMKLFYVLAYLLIAGSLAISILPATAPDSTYNIYVTTTSGTTWSPAVLAVSNITQNATRDTYQRKILHTVSAYYLVYWLQNTKQLKYATSPDASTWTVNAGNLGSFSTYPHLGGLFDMDISDNGCFDVHSRHFDIASTFMGSGGTTNYFKCLNVTTTTMTQVDSAGLSATTSVGGNICVNLDGFDYMLYHRNSSASSPYIRVDVQRSPANDVYAPYGGYSCNVPNGTSSGGVETVPYQSSSPYNMLVLMKGNDAKLYWNYLNSSRLFQNTQFTLIGSMTAGFGGFCAASEAISEGDPEIVHLVYVDASGNLQYMTYSSDAWSSATQLASDVSYPTIAVNDDGNLIVSYVSGSYVYYRTKTTGAWSAAIGLYGQYENPAYLSCSQNEQNGVVSLAFTANTGSGVPLPQTNSNKWIGIAAPHVYAAITIWSIAMIVGIGLVFVRGQNDLSALPMVILLGIGILICLFISLAVMSGFLRL